MGPASWTSHQEKAQGTIFTGTQVHSCSLLFTGIQATGSLNSMSPESSRVQYAVVGCWGLEELK